jgi:RimJ/RimL family protein N-acetyltransferase
MRTSLPRSRARAAGRSARQAIAPVVELRPLEHGDTHTVLEVFTGLGARSRELRFLTPKPRLTAADLRGLTQVDRHHHVAIVAVSGRLRRPIGIARFVRDREDPRTADVAVAVVDDWQDRGVGTLLVTALAQRAGEVGVRRFTVLVSTGNEPVLRLLHRSGARTHGRAIDRETAEYVVRLDDTTPFAWSRQGRRGGEDARAGSVAGFCA